MTHDKQNNEMCTDGHIKIIIMIIILLFRLSVCLDYTANKGAMKALCVFFSLFRPCQ